MIFNKKVRIRSNYDENEEFDFDEAPKHFDSVTDASVKAIKQNTLISISQTYKGDYSPAALLSMLRSASGSFDSIYAQLEGDYASRRAKLETAYQTGIAEVSMQLMEIELRIAEHNELFDQYSEAMLNATGHALDDKKLRLSAERYEELLERVKKLEKVAK